MVVASGDARLPRLLRRSAGAEVDRLYRRHSGEVYRYALLVLRSRPDAEDITQTVFMRALRAIARGERVRAPRNWLVKIAHNECRRLLSTRRVHAELPAEIAVEPAEQGRAQELQRALGALPATQRAALVMRELEGRSYVEIAETMDLSVSAVETLIFRARRSLREQIENALPCEEFAALLDDPASRSRVRAHARVCPDCATLERRARGRKGALRRIASLLGLPLWLPKVAVLAVATGTITAVALPSDQIRARPLSPIRPAGPSLVSFATTSGPAHAFKLRVHPPMAAHTVSGTPRVVPSTVPATRAPGAAAPVRRSEPVRVAAPPDGPAAAAPPAVAAAKPRLTVPLPKLSAVTAIPAIPFSIPFAIPAVTPPAVAVPASLPPAEVVPSVTLRESLQKESLQDVKLP